MKLTQTKKAPPPLRKPLKKLPKKHPKNKNPLKPSLKYLHNRNPPLPNKSPSPFSNKRLLSRQELVPSVEKRCLVWDLKLLSVSRTLKTPMPCSPHFRKWIWGALWKWEKNCKSRFYSGQVRQKTRGQVGLHVLFLEGLGGRPIKPTRGQCGHWRQGNSLQRLCGYFGGRGHPHGADGARDPQCGAKILCLSGKSDFLTRI